MEGKKVLGFWGAMHPWQEGTITSHDTSNHEIVITWDAEEGYKPQRGYFNARDIRTSEPMSEGVGLYFINN